MHYGNVVEIVCVVVTPVALGYSWIFYFKKMFKFEDNWRKRVTFTSLILVSFAVLAWPFMEIFMPSAGWSGGSIEARQVAYVLGWAKIVVWVCVAGLILSFFGRPRLILPMAVAYLGTAFFWIITSVPW